MSEYLLTPTGYRVVAGAPWSSYSGTVAGGNLSDGYDPTGIRWWGWSAPAGSTLWELDCADKTLPGNEVAAGAFVTVRSRRQVGSGSATCAVRVGSAVVGPAVSLLLGSSFGTRVGGSFARLLTADEVNSLGVRLSVAAPSSTSGTQIDVSEVSVTLRTASLPLAPVVSAPTGSVADSTRPTVSWTHVDRTEVAVASFSRSGSTMTITTGTNHGFVAGQDVRHDTSDARANGSYTILSTPTSTTYTVAHTISGTIGTTAVTGSAWVGDDKPQVDREVAVFTAAQFGAAGFDPATSTAAWRAPATEVTASMVTPLSDLANGTYRAYVRTAVSIAGRTVWSPWAYSSFTMAVAPQAAPDLAATWDETTNKVVLAVEGRSNMLSENQANGCEDTTTTGWGALTNCTVDSSTTVAKSGSRSLRLTSAASGTMYALASARPVVAGQSYTALAHFRAGASARACSVDLVWLDAANSVLSSSTGSASNDATGSWLARSVTATAPAGAAKAHVQVKVASTGGASELHYVDEAGLFPGTHTTWAPGGSTGAFGLDVLELFIERSDDAGETWTRVRTPGEQADGTVGIVLDASQSLTVDDHEAPRGASVTYRASIVSASLQASTAATDTVVTTMDGACWLKAVTAPDLNAAVRHAASSPPAYEMSESQGVFAPEGREDQVVVGGTLHTPDVTLTLLAADATEWAAVKALLAHQGTLLWQEPYTDPDGVAEQQYVRVKDRRSWSVHQNSTPDQPFRTVTVPCTGVGRGY